MVLSKIKSAPWSKIGAGTFELAKTALKIKKTVPGSEKRTSTSQKKDLDESLQVFERLEKQILKERPSVDLHTLPAARSRSGSINIAELLQIHQTPTKTSSEKKKVEFEEPQSPNSIFFNSPSQED